MPTVCIRVLVIAPLPVVAVQVTPADHEFWMAGETAQFHALPLAANGQPLPDRLVSWSSSNPVDASGLVTAHASGTAVIVARTEGIAGAVEVRVLILNGSDHDLLYALVLLSTEGG